MTVTELMHGRGTPISLHELTVELPAFFAYKRRQGERDAAAAEAQTYEERRRL